MRPQRRQLDSHHAEPVEQILAKLSRANLLLQIAVRGANHSHIHGDWLRPAQPLDGAVLEYAQHFRLRHRIHVPNFIQENRAARSQLELSFFLLRGARKRPALVTEQFRFDQRLWQRRAIHRNTRFPCPRRAGVNLLRQQIFSRAALSQNQHGRIRPRHAVRYFKCSAHLG